MVDLRWIRLGVGAGLATCLIYPSLIFVPWPRLITVTFAAAVGPLLGMACVGLYRLLRLHRRSLTSELGVISNVLAGCLFSTMLLLQFAVRQRAAGARAVDDQLVAVWLGIDVAWDAYIGLGTAMFAVAMWGHPRFGRGFAVSGLLIAVVMLAFNIYTFPEPPAESGLIDLGPLVGLWYLAVTIQTWRSLGWARQALEAGPPADGGAQASILDQSRE